MIKTWREYHTTVVVLVLCMLFFIVGIAATVSLTSGPSDPNPDCSGKHGGIVGPPTYTHENSTLYYTCKDGTIIQKP